MTAQMETLQKHITDKLGDAVTGSVVHLGELTVEARPDRIEEVCRTLRDDALFGFEELIDLCGVDYQDYRKESEQGVRQGPRFAVVYHLLSVKHNRRIRVRAFPQNDDAPIIPSVINIWASANWYEREAFDMFGILFEGHPDLRRILTDYGFVGHPFRKDFPLSGHVEMRYDPEQKRVIYQPVTVEPRNLVPRVIREEGYGAKQDREQE
ncbi:MAG: NADH-quinone oxidoreductase subunit C [Gammaproteobacteria bacterium]|nr:NADH-quinone oxidoreductase subunit C [Gammaproteobacteria bacterium]